MFIAKALKLNKHYIVAVLALTLLASWGLSTVASDFDMPGNEFVTSYEYEISSFEPDDPSVMCAMIFSYEGKGFPYTTSAEIETSSCTGKSVLYPLGHAFNAALVFVILYSVFVMANLAISKRKDS